MKKNKKLKLYGLMLFLLIFIVPLTLKAQIVDNIKLGYENKNNLLKSSGFWTIGTLDVDDLNPSKSWETLESTYDWISGSGTLNEPYIVENVTFTDIIFLQAYSIRIRNSNKFFILKNCSASNSLSGQAYFGPVYLFNTSNGLLIGNNFSNSEGTGIILENSFNNTIKSNNLSNNIYHGILFRNDCSINKIESNILNNNSASAIYLWNNSVNNELIGNSIDGKGNTQWGFALGQYCSQNLIDNNEIFNITKEGITMRQYCDLNQISNNHIKICNYGIKLEDSGDYNQLIGNIIEECSWTSISIDGDDSYGLCQFTNITKNRIFNSHNGVILGAYTEDSILLENIIEENSGIGINLYAFSRRNIVSDNEINLNKWGIYLQNTNDYHKIVNNTIQNNTEYGIWGYYSKDQIIIDNFIGYNNFSGIELIGCSESIISGNIIEKNNISGIEVFGGDSNIVSGNKIINNLKHGIHLENTTDNSILLNTIFDNNNSGIILINANNTLIRDNSLSGNSVCINEINCLGTIKIDNICIPNESGISLQDILDTLTNADGLIIGGSGFILGLLIALFISSRKKK